MNKYAQFLHQIRGGENPLDMLWCALVYGASPNNYRDFDFQHLTWKQRNSYVTHRLSERMIAKFNNPEYCDIFEDKTRFAETFSEYFGRKWISTDQLTKEALEQFAASVGDQIIYKPTGSAQGQGIKVFKTESGIDDIWTCIRKLGEKAILEEWIQQHDVLNKVYADAVNCLRIITLQRDGQVFFLAGGVTWGIGEKIANASASGIVSPVDFETGILEKPAADFHGNIYYSHPLSKTSLVPIQLPYWEETKEMLVKAANVVPEVGYIGWDIAITPNGPILIEGNTTPGYRYYQIPSHMENKKGNKAVYIEHMR